MASSDVGSATPGWFTTALDAPVEVGEVDVAGVPIAYRTWGGGADVLPPAEAQDGTGPGGILLVHGGAAHSRWWDHVAPLLLAGVPRVVALDLSGHGDSGRRDSYGLATWADEVQAVVEHAGIGPEPVVVGHSMGGMVALAAALRFGESLRGVVVIDSPVRARPPEERAARDRRAFGPLRTYPSREQATAHFRLVPEQPGALPYVQEHIAATSVREVAGGWAWKFDPAIFAGIGLEPAQLATVACRVALFRAEHGLVPAEMGDMIVDRMGRVVPVVEIPAAGHHVMLDQPLALVTGLRTLLADWRHSTPLLPPTNGTLVA